MSTHDSIFGTNNWAMVIVNEDPAADLQNLFRALRGLTHSSNRYRSSWIGRIHPKK